MRPSNPNAGLRNLQDGSYSSQGEKITWTYYDEANVPAVAGTVQYFQNPISGTKTIGQTNMVSAGQMPQGQKMNVEEIHVQYRSKDGITTIADQLAVNKFLDRAILQFKISNKAPMIQVKLSEILGLSMMTPTQAGAGSIAMPQVNLFTGKRKLNTPITLASLTPFNVELVLPDVPDASIVDDVITVNLNGTLIRAL